jgi:hypothetical protein
MVGNRAIETMVKVGLEVLEERSKGRKNNYTEAQVIELMAICLFAQRFCVNINEAKEIWDEQDSECHTMYIERATIIHKSVIKR